MKLSHRVCIRPISTRANSDVSRCCCSICFCHGDNDCTAIRAVFHSVLHQILQELLDAPGVKATDQPLGRLDGDADLDLFFARRGGASAVWLNNGAGTFTDTGQSLGNANTYVVALGDLNGDGDVDAFLGNDGGNTVWFNNGNGTFSDSLQLLGVETTVAVHLFDADADGDIDAWATNGDGLSQATQVWLNDGTGHFTDSGWALASTTATASAIGNLDNDTDLDVLVVSFDGDHQVWLNQYSGPIFLDGFNLGNTNAWSAVVP